MFIINWVVISTSDSFSERAAELSALNTEGYSTINCSTEFEPDIYNSSDTKRVKKLNILQTKHACFCHRNVAVFESQLLLS